MESTRYTINNCEVSLILTWFENCILTSQAKREVHLDADPIEAGINKLTGKTFKITGTKLSVPVVTLSNQDGNKLLYN